MHRKCIYFGCRGQWQLKLRNRGVHIYDVRHEGRERKGVLSKTDAECRFSQGGCVTFGQGGPKIPIICRHHLRIARRGLLSVSECRGGDTWLHDAVIVSSSLAADFSFHKVHSLYCNRIDSPQSSGHYQSWGVKKHEKERISTTILGLPWNTELITLTNRSLSRPHMWCILFTFYWILVFCS